MIHPKSQTKKTFWAIYQNNERIDYIESSDASVTYTARAEGSLKVEAAVTDVLTGLHNRRYMSSQLQALVARTNHGGEPVALLVLDIDHFFGCKIVFTAIDMASKGDTAFVYLDIV